MSAECGKCGFDLVYLPGTWPVGVCQNCADAETIASLEAVLAAALQREHELREAAQALVARLDAEDDPRWDGDNEYARLSVLLAGVPPTAGEETT